MKDVVCLLPFKNLKNSEFGTTLDPEGFGYGIVGLQHWEPDPGLERTPHGWSGYLGSHCTACYPPGFSGHPAASNPPPLTM